MYAQDTRLLDEHTRRLEADLCNKLTPEFLDEHTRLLDFLMNTQEDSKLNHYSTMKKKMNREEGRRK